MRTASTSLIVSLAAFALAGPARATVHHVAAGESIQVAIDAAEPGDVIQIAAGEFAEDLVLIDTYLTLFGAPGGGTRITGEMGAGPLIRIVESDDTSQITLDHLVLEGGDPAIRASFCDGVDLLLVSEVEFDAPFGDAIEVTPCAAGVGSVTLDVWRSSFRAPQGAAVRYDAVYDSNQFHAVAMVGSSVTDAGEGIVVTMHEASAGLGTYQQVIVTDSALHDIDDTAIEITHYGRSLLKGANVALVRNEVWDSAAGFELRCGSDSLLFPLECAALVSSNVLDHNDGDGLAMLTDDGGAFHADTLVSNNTIVGNAGDGVRIAPGNHRSTVSVINDIVAHNDGYGVAVEDHAVDGEWSHCDAFANGGGATGGEAAFAAGHPATWNPGFVEYQHGNIGADNDLHLTPQSACVDAGHPDAWFDDEDGTRSDMGAYGGPYGLTGIFADDDGDGVSELAGDCDDGDASISPDGTELPHDGLDQDCDGFDRVDVDTDGFRGVVDDGYAAFTGAGALAIEVDPPTFFGSVDVEDPDVSAAVALSEALTLEAWVRFTGEPGTTQALAALTGESLTGEPVAHVGLVHTVADDEGYLGVYFSEEDANSLAFSGRFVGAPFQLADELGRWHHVAVVVASRAVRFYLDGELVDQAYVELELTRLTDVLAVGGLTHPDWGPPPPLEWPAHVDIDDVRLRWEAAYGGDFAVDPPPGRAVAPEGCETLWSFDGVPVTAIPNLCLPAEEQGEALASRVGQVALDERRADCDDDNGDVYPGAEEICDGLDSDCDGEPGDDELDADGDGFLLCGGPAEPDCDDADGATYPGAAEQCDGADNDCDGDVDEGLEIDTDGDGYAGAGSCIGPVEDCDDASQDISPAAIEDCADGVDNDCDGERDTDDADCAGWEPPVGEDEYVGYACSCRQQTGDGADGPAALLAWLAATGWLVRRRAPRRR